MPPAGAVVITGGNGIDNEDGTSSINVRMSPPAGWANHNGPCELIGTRVSATVVQEPIGCGATIAYVDAPGVGAFVFRVRAYEPGNPSNYVDSATRTVNVRRVNPCKPICPGPRVNWREPYESVPVVPLLVLPLILGVAGGLAVSTRRRPPG
jgi:hypothetical protein